MREIKFRAWDKRNKVYVTDFAIMPTSPTWSGFPIEYPNDFHEMWEKLKKRASNNLSETDEWEAFLAWFATADYHLIDGGNFYGIENYIIEQYIGLRDENGDEIYEGDIIKAWRHNLKYFLIVFIEGRFCATRGKLDEYPIEINYFYPIEGCIIEVVGNIHENPELL